MITYDDREVHEILTSNIRDYYNYLLIRLKNIKRQANAWADIKEKIVYDDPMNKHGDFRPMTCFTDRAKVVKVIATNPVRMKHPSISVGTVIAFDMEENYPIALFDASALSSVRTAAMALLAMEFNSIPEEVRVLLIGRGRIGKYFQQMSTTIFPDTYLHSTDLEDGNLSASQMDTYNGYDVVVTATNSMEAIITPDNCDAKLVISVGADTHFHRELSHDFLRSRGDIYVDVMDAKHIGDLELAKDLHSGFGIQGDLFAMMERRNAEVFISVGSPLMDALTVEFLLYHDRR